jgi:hypothetical protein
MPLTVGFLAVSTLIEFTQSLPTSIFQVTQTAQKFVDLTPFKGGFSFTEISGNKEATSGIYTLDGSIDGGKPIPFRSPWDWFLVISEGSL